MSYMAEDSFKKGETAYYHEDGLVCKVEVLSNLSDAQKIRYNLKVSKIIRESWLTLPPEVGEEFEFFKLRNASCTGLGHLLEECPAASSTR